ncbi:MAG TPA: PQQ-dependent sugar dehydrogenase [Sphingomicrobium sp.]|jgi:glucose/arabinose dehydrogenase
MKFRWLQLAALLAVAACGTSARTKAQDSAAANLPGSDPPFTIAAVAKFDNPWAMAFLPGSNIAIVTEKPGKVWLIDVASGQKQPVNGAPQVAYGGQGGLLDVVLAPAFANSGQVYLTYSEPSPNGGSGLALARARLVRDTSGARLDGLQVLWRDPAGGGGGQFGGIVAFAPDGQSLFLSAGERQRFTPAQDPSQPIGKILHLTLDGKPAPGNPWADKSGAASVSVIDPPKDTEAAKDAADRQVTWPGPNLTPAETWSLGHRNPYGLAFAPDGRLWETEMGPRGGDELNLIEPGKNYGWPLVSQGRNYDGVPIPPHSSRPDIMAPKLYWVPSISPTSLLFYSGKIFPEWKGDALIGSMSDAFLIHVRIRGDKASKVEQWDLGQRIRFVAEGPDGAIYLLEDGSSGRMLKLTSDQVRR